MVDLGLTGRELARIVDACRWVRASPGLLVLLRRFLDVRLADSPALAAKVRGLDAVDVYRLWEHIRDEQDRHVLADPSPSWTRKAREVSRS